MWKTVTKWSILSLLLIYVVVMFFWGKAQASSHVCKGIDVEIHNTGSGAPVTDKGVMEVLKEYPKKIEGAPLNTINTLDVEAFLKKFNNFENVECLITGQGHLKIVIVPMVPEIRVFDGDRSYYVNKDGKTMDASHNFYADVPIVSGHFSKNFRPESILPIVRFIQKDEVLSNLVSMIMAKDKDNILLIPRIKGHVINMGDTTRLPEKKRAILTAYKQIIPYRGWETYDTISVKFRGQIVATRRDKTPLYPLPEILDEEDLEESALLSDMQGEQTFNATNTTEE